MAILDDKAKGDRIVLELEWPDSDVAVRDAGEARYPLLQEPRRGPICRWLPVVVRYGITAGRVKASTPNTAARGPVPRRNRGRISSDVTHKVAAPLDGRHQLPDIWKLAVIR